MTTFLTLHLVALFPMLQALWASSAVSGSQTEPWTETLSIALQTNGA